MLLLGILLTGGCAQRAQTTTVGDLSVHTLRRAFANTHVVDVGGQVLLVDPGSEEGAADMAESLRDAGFDPTTFAAVLLTHGHADHAGAAAYFRETYGTPIVGGRGDEPMFASGANDELCPTNARAENMVDDHQGATYTPFLPDLLVDGRTTLEAFGLPAVTVEPLPGHTAGSLVATVGGVVFVGDTIRGSIAGKHARTHFYICDEDDNHADVVGLLQDVPDGRMFFTGHFGPVDRDAVQQWTDEAP